MAQDFAKTFYNTARWKKCRNAYIQKRLMIDGGLCEECHDQQGYIVHHKITINESNVNDCDVVLNEKNLMYVCKACHDAYEGHGPVVTEKPRRCARSTSVEIRSASGRLM